MKAQIVFILTASKEMQTEYAVASKIIPMDIISVLNYHGEELEPGAAAEGEGCELESLANALIKATQHQWVTCSVDNPAVQSIYLALDHAPQSSHQEWIAPLIELSKLGVIINPMIHKINPEIVYLGSFIASLTGGTLLFLKDRPLAKHLELSLPLEFAELSCEPDDIKTKLLLQEQRKNLLVQKIMPYLEILAPIPDSIDLIEAHLPIKELSIVDIARKVALIYQSGIPTEGGYTTVPFSKNSHSIYNMKRRAIAIDRRLGLKQLTGISAAEESACAAAKPKGSVLSSWFASNARPSVKTDPRVAELSEIYRKHASIFNSHGKIFGDNPDYETAICRLSERFSDRGVAEAGVGASEKTRREWEAQESSILNSTSARP